MKKDPQYIVQQITELVTELAELAGFKKVGYSPKSPSRSDQADNTNHKTGATGGIRLLIKEGELDKPKPLVEIIELLRQNGRHYSNATVSMGLLNLVRTRSLIRLRDQEKKWRYVVRK